MARKLKWLDRALVVAPFYYTLCANEKLFKKVLDHLRIPKAARPSFIANHQSDATVHYFEKNDPHAVSAVVCIRPDSSKERSAVYALLVHEAVHLWQETRKLYGESAPSAEFEAYAVQNLSQALIDEYDAQVAK